MDIITFHFYYGLRGRIDIYSYTVAEETEAQQDSVFTQNHVVPMWLSRDPTKHNLKACSPSKLPHCLRVPRSYMVNGAH